MIDIIIYNFAWLASIAVVGISYGYVFAWKPIVGKILFVSFVAWFVYTVAWMITTPVELGGGFSTDRQWYHFIGSVCGGLVWSDVFGIGKDIYARTVIE